MATNYKIWTAGCLLFWTVPGEAQTNRETAAETKPPLAITMFELPRISLSQFGGNNYSATALARAEINGLKFTDLPSIGSGLAWAGGDEFYGITDRGPNGKIERAPDEPPAHRTFPLPDFHPAIIRFKLVDHRIQVVQYIPLLDQQGNAISGLSNEEGDEPLFESGDATYPIPFDPNGVDPEGIRLLPSGGFLVSEEYAPSILVVSAEGKVLMRYTPLSKPLPGTSYPVQAILPAVYAQRRINKGFESLALSKDGRFAYVILQSPLGEEPDERSIESRIFRTLKLDVSDPLHARVVGEYLINAALEATAPCTPPQQKLGLSDAEWIGPDRLLLLAHGSGVARLLSVDLSEATDILYRPDEGTLVFDDPYVFLSHLGVRAASAVELFTTAHHPEIDSEKIEGLAVLDAFEVALASDNDFGIGENPAGQPSKVWKLQLPALREFVK